MRKAIQMGNMAPMALTQVTITRADQPTVSSAVRVQGTLSWRSQLRRLELKSSAHCTVRGS